MFEQYISDWLTSYLGHFLDIKRENLRANILSAFSEPAGLTLRNVKLKTEALDFFQLPVAVEEAVVGSLYVRCPWGLRGRNIIELSDVYIYVSPRSEADWEEGPAKRRAYATKRAQLSAAEASRQLTGTSTGQKGGYGWSFLTWGGSILLNKLQFRMKRTHICFKISNPNGQGKATEFGIHLGLVETGYDDQKIKIKMKESGTVKQAAKVLRDISVQQLLLYWQASNPEEQPSKTSSMESDAWQHVEHPVSGTSKPLTHDTQHQPGLAGVRSNSSVLLEEDNVSQILPPTNCDLRISMKTDKHTGVTRLGAVALVERVQLQLHKDQICDIARMQDQYAVWNLHNQYGVLRPTGWRSHPGTNVSPRRLWQFAIHAVLQDLGEHQLRRLTGDTLLKWRNQRQRYVELWTHHLNSLKGSSDQAKHEQEQEQIEALEMQLLVPDILLFCHLASRALKRRPSLPGPHTPVSEGSGSALGKDSALQTALEVVRDLGSPKEGSSQDLQSKETDSPPSASSRQGWWNWGLSGVSSILGYVPSKEQPQALPMRPTQAEMQELYAALSLDPHNLPDGKDPSRKLEVVTDVKIASTSVTFSDDIDCNQSKQLASVDLEQLKVHVQLSSEETQAEVTVQEITVLDLAKGSASSADVVLTRWQQSGSGSSTESLEQLTARSSSSLSLSNSFVVVPELRNEPPLLKLQFTEHQAREHHTQHAIPDLSPKLQVVLQALHINHRPACWASLSGLTTGISKGTHSSRVADATNQLNSVEAQRLAQAQRAVKGFMLPTITLQVDNVVLVSQHDDPTSDGCSIVNMGAIQVAHDPEPGHLAQQQRLLQQLQQHVMRQDRLSSQDLQQLLTQVQTKVLYQRLRVSIEALQLSTGSSSSSLSAKRTAVLNPCQCTAHLDLHRASGDALLPQLKALVELDRVQVYLTPASMAHLKQSLLQSDDEANAEQSEPEHKQQGLPLAEVNLTAGTVSVAFEDTQGQESDASSTQLKLRGQKLDVLLELMQGAVATKATMLQLHASDRSKYRSKNPKIYGTYPVPRLAQVMSIDSLTVRLDQSQGEGLLVSGRLLGATAKGWPGESGSMISRLTSSIPAQAEFTVYNTVERVQTSITLQDGCFGTATLMRIAALFMPSPTPPPLPNLGASTSNTGSLTPNLDSSSHAQDESSSAVPGGLHTHTAGDDSAFGLSSVPESSPQAFSSEHQALQQEPGSQADLGCAPTHAVNTGAVVDDSTLGLAPVPESSPSRVDSIQEFTTALQEAEHDAAESNIVLTSAPAAGLGTGSAAVDSAASFGHASDVGSRSSSSEPSAAQPQASADPQQASSSGVPQTHDLQTPSESPAERSELRSLSPPMASVTDQGLLTAIDTQLGSSTDGLQAEEQAAAIAASAMTIEGVTDTSTLPEDEQQVSRSPDLPADTAEPDRDGSSEPYTPRGASGAEEEEVPLKRKEQFSLEIVRCKIVCPAKVDAAGFTDGDPSPLDHTLYMEIPHFLLQLPLSQPAQHPRPHPVDLNIRHVRNRQQPAVPAPDVAAPSPFAATGQQGTIFSLTNLALYVALPEEFHSADLASSSSEAHTQLPPLLSIPTASLLALPSRSPPQHASLHSQVPDQAVPTFELEIKTAEVIAKPAQLQTMSASTIRYSTEMDTILGKPPSDPTISVLAPTADPSLQTSRDQATVQRPSQRSSKGSKRLGFAVEASIGLISLQLHSSNAQLPALVLHWQRLSGHYAQAAGQSSHSLQTTCGLTWHYLALQFTEKPAEPRQQFSLEHVGTLRSCSLHLPGRMNRVHSEPLGGHAAPSSSRSSHHGSGHLTRGGSVHGGARRRIAATRTMSPEEDFLVHQHSLSRVHVAPLGNGRTGLGLTGLAEIAADDDNSTPSSPQYIFNNRARLASDSFAEALEEILPSLSSLSLNKASNQQQEQANSENGSSSLSGSRSHSHRHDRLGRLRSLGRATSVASSGISIEELQRQVPVIRHRSVFMNPTPHTPYMDPPDSPDFASAAGSFDLSSASSYSSRQGSTVFHDAPDRLSSTHEVGGMPRSPGGTVLREGWSPALDELPPGDRLLLLLGSKRCFAASDGIASSSTDASIGCILLPGECMSVSQSSLEVCASDMMLRVYLEGWQLLIHSSQESFAAVMKGQQQPQQTSHAQPSRAPDGQPASSSPFATLAAAAQGLSVQLHATEIVAELVANTLQGTNAQLPCVSISTAVIIDSHITPEGQMQHRLAVPRLALATALIELPPDIRSMVSRLDGGVLLGALGFQATLTLPITPGCVPPGEPEAASDELSTAVCFHTAAGQQQHQRPDASVLALDLNLHQLSVFASQRRLCITAALVKAVQEVEKGLLMLTRPATTSLSVEVAPVAKAQGALSFETLLKTRCSLQANKLALLLSNDKHDDDMPIIEAAASDVTLGLAGQAHSQQLSSQCGMKLHVDVYNNALMGWEPLLEPWASSVALQVPLARQGGKDDSLLVPHQLSVTLNAEDTLELTLTQAVMDSYQATQEVVSDVSFVAAEPQSLQDVIRSDEDNPNPGGEAIYWLQNLTDMPLEFWSRGPRQSERPLPVVFEPSDLGEGGWISPGASESVIPLNIDKIVCKGRHVADPQVFLASSTSHDAEGSSTDDSEAVNSHRQAGLKVLVRLQGQGSDGQPLGPWALDVEQKSMKEVQLSMPGAHQEAQQTFKVYCQVVRGVRGGAGLTIHSGIRLHNSCGMLLSIGMQQKWSDSSDEDLPSTTQLVAAGASIWLPALCCNATYLTLQPADEEEKPSTHHWCPGVPVLQLLHQAEYAYPASHCQDLVCGPVNNRFYPAHFCLGASAVPHTQGYTLLVKAPIEVYNALPVPMVVAMFSSDPKRSPLGSRITVSPLESCLLHHIGAFKHLRAIQLEPTSYNMSPEMIVPQGPSPHNGSDYIGLEVAGKASVQVSKQRRQDGSASLSLCHCYDPASGAHVLRVSCSLWVFNCTGLPIALRQSWLVETFKNQEHMRGDTHADAVPTAWVSPYRGSSQQPLPSVPSTRRPSDPNRTPSQSSQSSSVAGRVSSRFNLSGLGGVLTPSSVHSEWPTQQSSIGSNPKGLSDTGQVAVLHQTPTRYASMQGDVEAHKQKVHLQLCATTATSHSGKAFWSEPVQLDALGGAAVVEAHCPMTAVTPSQKEAQAGYRLAVTAVQIPEGDGALALHVMPRYMLHNNLQVGVQYKQQGQSVERDLLAGGARAVHWPDVTKSRLRLCLRLHEAGWQWSGGFALDTPGDLFVKIRHREQEVTRLVRVDVSTSANGVLAVALSEQEKGFAPYRLDNCTGLKLHLRQKGCIEQDDLLRPYSSLDYAWDEPALPHKLLLELPGNRKLGEYELDNVGFQKVVTVHATAQRAEQRIQVCVRADGPKRVLQLIDSLVHVQPSTAQQELVRAQLGWEPWSGTLHPGPPSRAAPCGPALAGVTLEVKVQIGGLGVSLVGQQEELLYGRITGIQLRAVTGIARQTLELAVQQVQVDNPSPNAAYPITAASPHVQSRFFRVATAVAANAVPKPAALCLRWSVWRSRPGHVVCVERLEMQTAPLLLELEQAHAMQLMSFGNSMVAPFTDESERVKRRRLHEPDLMVLRAGGRQRVGGDKVYIEYLHVTKLEITLSFLPAPGVFSGYQWFLSVGGQVERAYVGLAPLELHHPLLSRQALIQSVHSHYMRTALPGLLQVLANADVLGSPKEVIHHLGLGIWSFLASPAQGLRESTQGGGLNLPRLINGFAEGSRSLTSNVVLAVSTATSKTTATARRGLISMGLDKLEATAVPLRQRLQTAGSPGAAASPGPGFLPAVAEGLKGFVCEPARGIQQHGLSGLPFGILKGSLGIFGHPLGSLLGTAASLSGSIRHSLLGVAMLPPRLRPPRHVSSREPLSLHNHVDALGRALLRTLEDGKHSNEGFVACRHLYAPTAFVIITRVHILSVQLPHLATSRWAPQLTWAAALGDIQLCTRRGDRQQQLHIMVMQPQANLLESQQLMAQKALGIRLPVRLPWQAYMAVFEVASDAAEVQRLIDRGAEQICAYGILPVHRGGYLASSYWQGFMLHDQSMWQRMQAIVLCRREVMVQQIMAVPCRQPNV